MSNNKNPDKNPRSKKIYRVTAKQHNSKMCFICGVKNHFGLKASFYETDGNELIAIFKPSRHHQGYPERLHGGIAAAVLDEAIGRNINTGRDSEVWGVTVEFNIRYFKPVPLDREIKAVTRLTSENKRFFTGSGEIILENGEIAVTAEGKYMKMPVEKISRDFTRENDDWVVVPADSDPEMIVVP
jgi:acyl-coenzyme A thioesterase PaaI-like protein